MPLNLHLKNDYASVQLDVRQVSPGGQQPPEDTLIYAGNNRCRLSDAFELSGCAKDDLTFCVSGQLDHVLGIGSQMTKGTIEVAGNAGALVGQGMAGGKIVVSGDVGDFLGAEMTGGQIVVRGNAGHYVGANRPGGKYGMNRGEIYIHGNAGESVGRRMRRGTIVIAGDVGALCGWEMLAGTIIVFGKSGQQTGLEMKRGTIILAGTEAGNFEVSPFFNPGVTARSQNIGLISNWLKNSAIEMDDEVIDNRLTDNEFLQIHGDFNEGGRGEIYVLAETNGTT